MKKLIEIPSLSYQLFNQAFLALQLPKRSAASPIAPEAKVNMPGEHWPAAVPRVDVDQAFKGGTGLPIRP
ncbi:hypothetical protein [Gibbsiella quercinecans]|uniref:hypothetical protein n=1 Tax=Gibbsiella quercinecans TaxID=929813 RepID=UPI00104F26F5|nr:hypothetical protein [Gibbsiella quercinecans]